GLNTSSSVKPIFFCLLVKLLRAVCLLNLVPLSDKNKEPSVLETNRGLTPSKYHLISKSTPSNIGTHLRLYPDPLDPFPKRTCIFPFSPKSNRQSFTSIMIISLVLRHVSSSILQIV